MTAPSVSVVITAHNEGQELDRTVRSVRDNTANLAEVIVVDDGSDDGSCDGLATGPVRVVRHERRVGVAASRDEGSRAARGDVLCYLDAHQRVGPGCLDRCAKVADQRGSIACPTLRNYGLLAIGLRGAHFRLCPRQGYFAARWRYWPPGRAVSPVTALRAPPYLVPRRLYPDIAWSRSLRGWGASEASVVVKSFFLGLEILHVAGTTARHRFRRKFPYATTWDGVWRNHAIIARVCFDDATWFRYWLPRVFEPHLSDEARAAIDSPAVQAEHETFLARKRKTDRQFWTELLGKEPPRGV
jgi:glycosyltransferase involved in cell wall biosynthesis